MPFWKTIRESSEETGVSESTISRRAKEGAIPSKPHPTDRRKKLVDPSRLEETGGTMAVNNPEGGSPEGGGGEAPPPQQGGSFIDKIPGGWMTIVIGLAALVLAYLTYRAIVNNQTVTPYGGGGGVPTSVTGSGTTPTDTSAGGAPDYTNAIQGLTSAEQQMAQSLQTFYSQFSGSQTDNGSGANAPVSSPSLPHPTSSIPVAKGTSTNLSTLIAYLRSVGMGNAKVQHVGSGAESGYLISGVSGINESQLLQHFGAGWTITRSGSNYLLHGPGAKKIHMKNGKVLFK